MHDVARFITSMHCSDADANCDVHVYNHMSKHTHTRLYFVHTMLLLYHVLLLCSYLLQQQHAWTSNELLSPYRNTAEVWAVPDTSHTAE
jgi:hypothetical protein